VNMTAA